MSSARGRYFKYNESGFRRRPYGPRPRKRYTKKEFVHEVNIFLLKINLLSYLYVYGLIFLANIFIR